MHNYYKTPDGRFFGVEFDVNPLSIPALPPDAIPATSAEHDDWQASILASKSQEIIEFKRNQVRDTRERILNALSGIGWAASAATPVDDATVSACLTVRQGLLRITDDWPTDPGAVDSLVMSRYAALQAQCTPAMVSAFREVAA